MEDLGGAAAPRGKLGESIQYLWGVGLRQAQGYRPHHGVVQRHLDSSVTNDKLSLLDRKLVIVTILALFFPVSYTRHKLPHVAPILTVTGTVVDAFTGAIQFFWVVGKDLLLMSKFNLFLFW